MESLVYDLLSDKYISFYLVKNYKDEVKLKDIKILMRYFDNVPLDFALIDLGDQKISKNDIIL